MKAPHTMFWACAGIMLVLGGGRGSVAATEALPDGGEIMRALADELTRSMNLQMEDLEKPYFIQYTVDDSVIFRLAASYGSITSSDRRRSRDFRSRVRVGSYELDSTNFTGETGGFGMFFGGGAGGGRASLPLEDDYSALRQAMWWATDQDYKDAVETLTKKRAYMRDKNLQDRPHDFSKTPVVETVEPTARMDFDQGAWEQNLRRVSTAFRNHPRIQESSVQLYAVVGNTYIVNSEGTRLRFPETGALLMMSAELQAEDGMKISDSLSYFGKTPDDFPAVEKILGDIDQWVQRLTQSADSPILERYTGPVLFENLAAAQMFRTLIAEAIAGRVDPVGTQRATLTGAGSLEKKLSQEILPDSFQISDDPSASQAAGAQLIGHYRYDDEGVKGERVDLVSDGALKTMVMSRAPTRKISGTNGHARRASGGVGVAEAAIGCLFVEDKKGISDEALKSKLIELARAEGLEYGLRVGALHSASLASSQSDIISFFMRAQRRGGQENVGDPIYIYKVHVADGHEEPVRGCEFGQVKLRDLRNIASAGKTLAAYNYIGLGFGGATPATSIVAPAVLFAELELAKIEQEHEKLPLLKAPLSRQP